jgi:hypothetical protein
MREAEVQIRTYIYPYGYSWIWYDTDNRSDSFKQFQVSIYQTSGMMAMGDGEAESEVLFSTEAAAAGDDGDAGYDISLLSDAGTAVFGDFDGIFPKLFATTAPADGEEPEEETTSLKAEANDAGETVAITVERVAPAVGKEAKSLLEGRSIVAANGIALYDIGTIEEQILYLVTEEIDAVTLADPSGNAVTYTAE